MIYKCKCRRRRIVWLSCDCEWKNLQRKPSCVVSPFNLECVLKTLKEKLENIFSVVR